MDAEKRGNSLKDQIRLLTVRERAAVGRNEQLFSKLGSVQDKAGQQAEPCSEQPAMQVQSDEETHKISRDLVDEANKMEEKYETQIFELKNKVLSQEGLLSSLEAEQERLKAEADSALARLRVAEGNERDMAEEYTALKSSFLVLSDTLGREITYSDALSEELLTLAHTHDTLLRERDRARKHTLEVDRVRALISRVAHSRGRPEELIRVRGDAITHTTAKHGRQNELREEMEKMRKRFEEVQQQLEEKIVAMGKAQQESKTAIHNTQQELAQKSAALIMSQIQLTQVESENSKLQNHLKQLNQEYRARLVHYIQDITECVQGMGDRRGTAGREQLQEFVESMLKEVRESYHSREEQLTSAVRTYRTRLHNLSRTHQLLLTAYRMQREQILSHTEHALEVGPPEGDFSPEVAELTGEAAQELHKLRQDKARLETQLKLAQEQVAVLSQSQRTGLTEEMWTDIRKQLREITSTTQETHEKERVQLITRATVAEEQVSELQEYIDNHLGRYKLEVTRLRSLIGLEAGRSQSADRPKPCPLHTSLQKTSCEI